MRLKREDWTEEDEDIATFCLLEMTHYDASEWVGYEIIFKPIRNAFPDVTDRHIAEIVSQLHYENKLIVHIKRDNVFLQGIERIGVIK